MRVRNIRRVAICGLLAAVITGTAGCEPSGWFSRDLGAPGPPDTAPAFARPETPPAPAVDFERLEADLRTVAEAAKVEPTAALTPPSADVEADDASLDPLEDAADGEPAAAAPSPELLALLEDPALKDAPEDRLSLALAREVVALRSDVERLRQQMDVQLGTFVRDLKTENARLRREVQRLYTLAGKAGAALPVLPGSGLYGESQTVWPDESTAYAEADPLAPRPAPDVQPGDAPPGGAAANDGPVALVGSSTASYAVMVEWGRTPDEALNVGPDVSSLRGMIVLVPPNTDAGSLATLGQQLRAEYADYDNINITVFDNQEAADLYAKTNSQEKGKPVMRISKFAARGEDTITVYQGDEVIEVPVEP